MSTMNLTLKKESKGKSALILIISIAIPLLLGFLSSAMSGDMRATYSNLNTPPLSPPGWLFGIVWPIMYTLMGIAFYMILRVDSPVAVRGRAIAFYIIQLALNIFWSPVFFGIRAYWPAVLIIAGMDIMVILCIYCFRNIRKAAGNLLIPYIVWLAFATYLSVGVAILN